MIRRTASTMGHAWEEAKRARQAFRKYDPARPRGEGRLLTEGFSYMRMMRSCLLAMQHISRAFFRKLR